MEQTFYLDSVDTVIFNQNNVDVIRLNKDIIWQSSNLSIFNFTGIDANGLYEGEVGYTTPVEYAIGQWKYTYYKKIEPTPTTEEEVIGKYYYNSSGGNFIEITSSNISSNVELGVTDIFDLATDLSDATTQYRSTGSPNNAFNSLSFAGLDFSKMYKSIEYDSFPNLGIDSIVLPSKHNDIKITTILPYAFYGFNVTATGYVYSLANQVKQLTLGENIETLMDYAFTRMCSWVGDTEGKGFNLNSKLKKIGVNALNGIYGNNANLIIPSSVTNISGAAFYDTTIGIEPANKRIINTITMTGDFESQYSTYALSDTCKYLIIESSVHNIVGDLAYSTTTVPSVVFKHGASDIVNLSLDSLKSATKINVYTDNDMVKSYNWATQNYTVTFYPLSDYTGG